MSDKILIGLTGEIGCGKSRVCELIRQKIVSAEYAMAKPLKDIAEILGFEHDEVYGSQEQKLQINKFWGISGREFLQKFGSEVCRDQLPRILPNMNFNGKTLWVRRFEKFYADFNGNIVVSDVRFADESKTIKDLGGLVCKIVRPNNQNRPLDDKAKHQSETQEITPDIILVNNGNLEELNIMVINMLKYISDNRSKNYLAPMTFIARI